MQSFKSDFFFAPQPNALRIIRRVLWIFYPSLCLAFLFYLRACLVCCLRPCPLVIFECKFCLVRLPKRMLFSLEGFFFVFFLNFLTKAFDCVDHNKLWKILKEMGIPDHLICPLRNLYAGQEATVRTGHGTADWFQIGKVICQGCILAPIMNSERDRCITGVQQIHPLPWGSHLPVCILCKLIRFFISVLRCLCFLMVYFSNVLFVLFAFCCFSL